MTSQFEAWLAGELQVDNINAKRWRNPQRYHVVFLSGVCKSTYVPLQHAFRFAPQLREARAQANMPANAFKQYKIGLQVVPAMIGRGSYLEAASE